MTESEFLKVAKKAAQNSGKVVLKMRGKKLASKQKTVASDFVTEADLASEKIIISSLKAKFPTHDFVSEEAGGKAESSEYTWVIDPIDGTIPYTAGLEYFGISIGLLKDKQPSLGVIYLPALDRLFWAEKGKGAYLNGKRIRVSREKKLIDSLVGFDFGYTARDREFRKIHSRYVDKVRYSPNLASSVAAMSLVASGVYGGYVSRAHPWDFVAGAAIVEEAGGRVTDTKGGKVDWLTPWITTVATNGFIHNQLIRLLK